MSSNMFNSPYQNHIMNMYQNTLTRAREEEEEEEAGQMNVEGSSSDDQRPTKRNYRRHTQQQIDQMDAFFKQCPHPTERQRKELSQLLGLEPTQIKFWFQNRRTSIKVQSERDENEVLKAENEKLQEEVNRYKEAIGTTCNVCGSPTTVGVMSHEEQQLRLENALLRKELERFGGQTPTNHADSRAIITSSDNSNQVPSRSINVGGNNGALTRMVGEEYAGGAAVPTQGLNDRQKIIELAVIGMDELTKLGRTYGLPLWIPTNNFTEILNEEEYLRHFPKGNGPNPLGLRPEGSKESVVVMMSATNLVDVLMDVNQWSNMFCGIVSRAATLKVLSTGVAGSYNGALQVMSAEFQVPSPLVPTRENYFVRYCKLHPDGIWVVADVSLHNMLTAASGSSSTSSRTQRRTSGCLIQQLPNGHSSKVIWIENVEVDDEVVLHNIYRPLINSGLAFGAKRWVATLQRQCDRVAFSMVNNISVTGDPSVFGFITEGKKGILNLAERMMASFSTSIGSSTTHAWTKVPGNGQENVMVMTKRYFDESNSERPASVVLSAATSFWLPVPPRRVFDFLRDQNSRRHWDILSSGGIVHELAHISNGRDPANYVSLLRINSANTMQSDMVILQENCTDVTGSYVVYAPVEASSMELVLSGGDTNRLALLPSGFAIFPDGCITNAGPIMNVGTGGSLVTVAFQILVDSIPHARIALGSITTVNTLIKSTVERIKAEVMPNVV